MPSNRCSNRRRSQQGFTFVGVLAVMTVMLITMGAVSEVWHTVMKRENEQELLFVGHQFRHAIGKYYEKMGTYPASLEVLLESAANTAGTARYLRKIYRDPITGDNKWGTVQGQDSKITGVYSLSDEAPSKVSSFIEADKSFEGKEKYSDWKFIYIPKKVGPQNLQGGEVNGIIRPVPRVRQK